VESTDEQFASEWKSCAAEKFLIVSRTPTGGGETQWVVDVTARTITVEDEADESEACDDGNEGDDVTWSILGSPQSWEAVLSGQLNLHAALRHNDLRYCPAGTGTDSPVASQNRIMMLADLLGVSAWARADASRQDTAAVA
jgi:hypothetical protein